MKGIQTALQNKTAALSGRPQSQIWVAATFRIHLALAGARMEIDYFSRGENFRVAIVTKTSLSWLCYVYDKAILDAPIYM